MKKKNPNVMVRNVIDTILINFFLLVVPVQTLGSKRFKLGATTSFLTRSLANHGLME